MHRPSGGSSCSSDCAQHLEGRLPRVGMALCWTVVGQGWTVVVAVLREFRARSDLPLTWLGANKNRVSRCSNHSPHDSPTQTVPFPTPQSDCGNPDPDISRLRPFASSHMHSLALISLLHHLPPHPLLLDPPFPCTCRPAISLSGADSNNRVLLECPTWQRTSAAADTESTGVNSSGAPSSACHGYLTPGFGVAST